MAHLEATATGRRCVVLVTAAALLLTVALAFGVAPPSSGASLDSCVSTDNGDAKLAAFSFSATTLNVTTAAKNVTVTAKASDTGLPGPASGIDYIFVSLAPDSNTHAVVTFLKLKNGTWTGSAVFPRSTTPGLWKAFVTVADKAGNVTSYDWRRLGGLGLDRDVSVTSVEDTTPPRVAAITFTHLPVNTTHKAGYAVVTVRTGDATGAGGGSITAQLNTHNLHAPLYRVATHPSLMRGRMAVPTWAGTGTARVNFLFMTDGVDNQRSYNYQSLGAAGVHSSFRVTSRGDSRRPTVSSVSASASSVDVRTTDKKVTFAVRAHDARSGVASVYVNIARSDGFVLDSFHLHRATGTARNGTWKVTGSISHCSRYGGTMDIQVIVYDRAGHSRTYRHQGSVSLRVGDHIAPEASLAGPVSTPAGPLVVDFNEPVNGIDTSSVDVAVYDFPDITTSVAGTWTCGTVSHATTSCLTGAVRRATFTPDADWPTSGSFVAQFGAEHHLGVTDLAGNPFRRYGVYFSTSS